MEGGRRVVMMKGWRKRIKIGSTVASVATAVVESVAVEIGHERRILQNHVKDEICG